MTDAPLLQAEHLHTYYGQSHVLQGVSVSLRQGELVAVLGRNGVGKTTLVRSLIGFTPPREGRITFRGREFTHTPPHQRLREGLALVPQGRRLFPSLTVEENLAAAQRLRGRPDGWDAGRILQMFPQLTDKKRLRAGLLSGGEQQMLAIGRALVSNPELLLLDEPTEGLSPLIAAEVMQILQRLKNEGLSMLLVEQNLGLALNVADTAFILSRGQVVYQDAAQALAADPAAQRTHLGVSMSVPGPTG